MRLELIGRRSKMASGQTATEYLLILTAIAIALASAYGSFGAALQALTHLF